MLVHVLFFGAIRESLQAASETLTLAEGTTAGEVHRLLAERQPSLKPLLKRTAIAINQSYVSSAELLHDGDEIAFLPPVSGGAIFLV